MSQECKRGPKAYPPSVTVWDYGRENVKSGWGDITYERWCELTVRDMQASGRSVAVGKYRGRIAVVEVYDACRE